MSIQIYYFPIDSKYYAIENPLYCQVIHIFHIHWRSQGRTFGGGQKGLTRRRGGTKECDQDEGSQEGNGAQRVTIELYRGRVIYNP